jgi:exonuclease III
MRRVRIVVKGVLMPITLPPGTSSPQGKSIELGAWLHSFYDPPERSSSPVRNKYPQQATTGILTQNVRGFKTTNRTQAVWMDGWKSRIDGKKIQCIAAQETHITSQAEAERLENHWCRVWGRKPDLLRPLTFATITPSKAAGVAFFLHPSLIDDGYRMEGSADSTGRCLCITTPQLRLINIYAPTIATQREAFFSGLLPRIEDIPIRTLMVGDFNCVLTAAQDRIRRGQWAPERCESHALAAFLRARRMVDVLDQHRRSAALVRYLTYWQGSTGARLDRGYVSAPDRKWIAGVETVVPVGPTDHSGVVIWMRDPNVRPLQKALAPASYPIQGRDPEAIERQVGKAVCQILENEQRLHLGIDATIRLITGDLRRIKRDERRRARRQRRKREARERAQIRTLADLF